MKKTKFDIRSKFTKKVISDSLLKALSHKQLKEITVSEICGDAEINRGTFYNHFFDIYDVYEYIEETFYDEVVAKFENIQFYSLDRPFYKEILLLITANENFTKLIISNIGGSTLLKKIVGYIRGSYIAEFSKQFPSLNAEKLETLFIYLTNGSIGIIVEWLNGGTKTSVDAIAEQINQLNTVTIKGFLKI